MNNQVARLKYKNNSLEAENDRLETELEDEKNFRYLMTFFCVLIGFMFGLYILLDVLS